MIRIIVGLLLLSSSMVTITTIGHGFPGILFMDDPKHFFLSEMTFTILGGIGLPIMLWGFADVSQR
jgi:hypothetical protein